MTDYEGLIDYKGWRVFWQSGSGKLFIRRLDGIVFKDTHDFSERPRSRIVAIDVAKAWIDRRR